MKVFVHSRRELGIETVKRLFAEGWSHDPAPYGFDSAEELVESLEFSRSRPPGWLSGKLFAVTGLDVLHALDNISGMARADVIWTVLEWDWAGVSLMQRLGLLAGKPIIANSVWLCEEWARWPILRRLTYLWLMTSWTMLTLHSLCALDRAKQLFPRKKFHLLLFGISSSAFPADVPHPKKFSGRRLNIYAIGSDATRDWPTFLAAFGNDDRFDIRLVTSGVSSANLAGISNIEYQARADVSTQRTNYLWADFVVVPMKENCFSGITVVCEAAAVGTPVVATRTGGIEAYFDDTEVVLVPPEDPAALRAAVISRTPGEALSLAVQAQRRFLNSDYTSRGMVRRYIHFSDQALKACSG